MLRERAFSAGVVAVLLSAIARGGLQLILVIWLQGIWLPLHGYSYADTPLWAGIFLLPLSAGFLVAGPICGFLSDRFGARRFATSGMILFGLSSIGLILLPVDFPFWAFALVTTLTGVASGMFSAPNTAAIMSSVPAEQRGVASGMRATFQNGGTLLSIGVFFSLMIVGLSKALPSTLESGLRAQGVGATAAHAIASLPPVSSLFAAFLGVNPMQHLLGPAGVLGTLSPAHRSTLLGTTFFPHLIIPPFHDGLATVFTLAAAMSFLAAIASFLRGSTSPKEHS